MSNPLADANDRNQENTVYIGNLDERVNEAIVWELLLQVAPVGIIPLYKHQSMYFYQRTGLLRNIQDLDL
jgi:splicing factor 3B subunit 4